MNVSLFNSEQAATQPDAHITDHALNSHTTTSFSPEAVKKSTFLTAQRYVGPKPSSHDMLCFRTVGGSFESLSTFVATLNFCEHVANCWSEQPAGMACRAALASVRTALAPVRHIKCVSVTLL